MTYRIAIASSGDVSLGSYETGVMFAGNALDEPKNNSLYQPWVEMADVEGMLTTNQGVDPDKSVLSSGFIAKIAERFLLKRYDVNSVRATVRHPDGRFVKKCQPERCKRRGAQGAISQIV
jgi:hypothetical protein